MLRLTGPQKSHAEVICSLWNWEPWGHFLHIADTVRAKHQQGLRVCVCLFSCLGIWINVWYNITAFSSVRFSTTPCQVSYPTSQSAQITAPSLSCKNTHTSLLPIIRLSTEGQKWIIMQPAPVCLKPQRQNKIPEIHIKPEASALWMKKRPTINGFAWRKSDFATINAES